MNMLFGENTTLDELKLQQESVLLLELVALQPIRTGDEILMDYGLDWIESWVEHVSTWQAPPNSEAYAPSYVQDDVIQALRTEAELQTHPYPENVFTSCFYKYSDNKERAESVSTTNGQSFTKESTTTFQWNMTRGLFELKNLRPCNVLQRHNPLPTEDQKKKGTTFTVQIRNRKGLLPNETIPKGLVHIVTNVPRYAIRLSDKAYTTDQHLPSAFRKEIGLPKDLYFPQEWQDHILN
jgi:hypothetical protein